MVESQGEYLQRKMKEIQDLIQEATEAQALGMPAVLDGFSAQAGGAFKEIKIIINEVKLNEYRKIKK
jgi:hypothetical protein